MLELVVILIAAVLADAINPALAATTVFALGTRRPYRGLLWVLLGWTVVYALGGIALAAVLARSASSLGVRPTLFAVQAAASVWLVGLAYQTARRADHRSRARHMPQTGASGSHTLNAGGGILLGATIAMVGSAAAAPYVMAIAQLLKAGLPAGTSIGAIGAYNIAYLLPFFCLALLRAAQGDGPEDLFENVNRATARLAATVKPLLLFLLGALLLIDAVYYFTAASPLIDVGS